MKRLKKNAPSSRPAASPLTIFSSRKGGKKLKTKRKSRKMMVSFEWPKIWKLLYSHLKVRFLKKKRCQTCWPGKKSTLRTRARNKTADSTSIKSSMIKWIMTHHRTI